MARFSTKKATPSRRSILGKTSRPSVENLAKGEAFQESSKLELVSTLLTSFVEDQFYRSRDGVVNRIISLVDSIEDKKFVAQATIFARIQFGMRSVSHLVAAELAKKVKGAPWMGKFLQDVVHRPDDITEILSAYIHLHGNRPIPNMFKQPRGLAGAFAKFDAYQLAKYKEETRRIKLIDAVNLLHPKPTAKNGEALKALVKGELRSTTTWESMLSKAGSDPEAKAAVWTQLIKEKKLGYMALLMNLRNISAQAPGALPEALKMLTNPEAVKKSMVLPFRFTKANEAIQGTAYASSISTVLAQAAEISLGNITRLPGKTLVALDVSGSMMGRPFDIGSMFATVLVKANDADLIIFSSNAKYLKLNPDANVFECIETIRKKSDFAGTDFHSIFRTANRHYDRIIILSDMQGWVGYSAPKASAAKYCKSFKADPKIWSFNLQDYGTLMFPEDNVYCVAGWSDKILGIMETLETNPDVLIEMISQVPL